MKNIYIFKFLLIGLIFLPGVLVAGEWTHFTGKLKALESDNPVAGQAVFIHTADSSHFTVAYTNGDGIYQDSLLLKPDNQVGVVVQIFDCDGISHQKTLSSLIDQNIADFTICNEHSSCEADFIFERNTSRQMHFLNRSSGDYDQLHWDFGDGTVSSEENPVHTYSMDGTYQVTLTIQDSDTECFAKYLAWVVTGDTIHCSADFNFQLDTLNNQPNTYIFNDISTGYIVSRVWDFGDGNFSTEPNPVHSYKQPGIYTVCLTVFAENGGNNCEDSKCEEIITPSYLNFGGHVFLDDFPLNVEPDDSSNTAVAHLYRKYDNQWHYQDSRRFWKFGYYWFADKLEGEYLIRVDLLPDSRDYGIYAPSYFKNTINWANAEVFHLESSEQFDVNVNMKPMTTRTDGQGSISGRLLEGENCSDEFSIEMAIIHLYDIKGNLINYTYTNPNGSFIFSGLSSGKYTLHTEMTGKYGEYVTVILSDSEPVVSELRLQFDCNAFLGMMELQPSTDMKVTNIYPQPAKDHLVLEVEMLNASVVLIEFTDMNGVVAYHSDIWLSEGLNHIPLSSLNLNSGLYILKIASPGAGPVIYEKVLIKR